MSTDDTLEAQVAARKEINLKKRPRGRPKKKEIKAKTAASSAYREFDIFFLDRHTQSPTLFSRSLNRLGCLFELLGCGCSFASDFSHFFSASCCDSFSFCMDVCIESPFSHLIFL